MANIIESNVTKNLLRECFDYHEDGYLIWKIRPSRHVKIGHKAGYLSYVGKSRFNKRYIIGLKGKIYLSARLIFLWHYGHLPEYVDHIDRDTLNDRINNLREATREENSRNRTSAKNSTSKYLGVSINQKSKKWVARINVGYKIHHIGTFVNQEDAALAYNREAVKYFKEFANLNIIKQ